MCGRTLNVASNSYADFNPINPDKYPNTITTFHRNFIPYHYP